MLGRHELHCAADYHVCDEQKADEIHAERVEAVP